mgnify:FL=1|tara:strand:- start:2377 stop:2577 length:201 start_codon:yes stop_codon:yes gene_type:complete
MKFLVTNISYDFNDSIDEPLSLEEQFEITNETLGVWEAEDEDDLLEEITACSGWCIENIDYEVQLK